VQTYSSAREDILRALQSAKARARASGHKVGPNTLIGPAPGAGGTTTTTGGTGGGGGGTDTSGGTATTGTTPSNTSANNQKGLAHVANELNPGSASSLPVPLLVLGGLALLLVIAGGAGLVVKQLQARRPGP
jgi:hypothetical protein